MLRKGARTKAESRRRGVVGLDPRMLSTPAPFSSLASFVLTSMSYDQIQFFYYENRKRTGTYTGHLNVVWCKRLRGVAVCQRVLLYVQEELVDRPHRALVREVPEVPVPVQWQEAGGRHRCCQCLRVGKWQNLCGDHASKNSYQPRQRSGAVLNQC